MVPRIRVRSATKSIVAIAFTAFAMACGGGGGDGGITPPPSGPASVELSPTGNHRLVNIGETLQLTATPKDAAGNTVSATVTWTSTATNVATVNSTGLVTATGFGTTTIRATAGGVSKSADVLVQAPDNTVSFNVNAEQSCSSPKMISAKLEATSPHLLIYSDVGNPANGFTTADYEEFAATFEILTWPVLTANFGVPTDIDNNGRVIALFTKAVNELTPANSTGIVGGFFFGRDLFPKTATSTLSACAGSNFAEMFYLLVPDPTGTINGNTRTVADVRRLSSGVIGHEMQHLINSSRRLYITRPLVWPETVYMEEGLSHIAEEMMFYEASGTMPRMNLGITELRQTQPRVDGFNAYMASNAARFRRYLENPSGHSPYQSDNDLETRGAIWFFLRHLADRGAPGTAVSGSEPVCASPVSLSVSQRCRLDGSAAAQFNVAAEAGSASEFTIVAFAAGTNVNPALDPSINTVASATSAIAVSGPPNPSVAPGGPLLSTFGASGAGRTSAELQLDYTVHDRIRAMERRDLPHRVPAARAEYARRKIMEARMYTSAPSTPLMAATAVEAIWSRLVDSPDTGIANLRRNFGQDVYGAARDWAVAHYVDDIGLSGLPVQYTHPSWNFRTLMPAITQSATYPIKVHSLTASTSLTMVNGGAAYYRLGVAAGGTSTVSFTVEGTTPTDRLKLTVVRTK